MEWYLDTKNNFWYNSIFEIKQGNNEVHLFRNGVYFRKASDTRQAKLIAEQAGK